MRTILILIFLMPIVSFSQMKKGVYGNIVAEGYISPFNNGYGNAGGVGVGIGYHFKNNLMLGGAVDYFPIQQNDNPSFGSAKIAFGYLFNNRKKVSPLISLEPGITIVGNTDKNSIIPKADYNGGFAFDALIGLISKPKKKAGFYFNAGYSRITFVNSQYNSIYKFGGIKAKIGLLF